MTSSISRQLAQQIVDTIEDVCGYNINFINTDGTIYASTDHERIGTFHSAGKRAAKTGETISVHDDDTFAGTKNGINIPIFYHREVIAVVGITAKPEEASRFAHLAERITTLLLHEQELSQRHRTNDEKKLYLIRCLKSGDFQNTVYLDECIEQFHLDKNSSYRMVEIEVNTGYNLVNISLLEQKVSAFFGTLGEEVYAYVYPNRFSALITADTWAEKSYMFERFAQEHHHIVKTAIGRACPLSKCPKSYQSALTALDSIREDAQKDYVLFDDLKLEILMASIDDNRKVEFKEALLKKLSPDDISFLKIYYDEDMSLQRTAEKLYLHKNTVQQRLNRIHAGSGLNPRSFKDAVLLYLALHA